MRTEEELLNLGGAMKKLIISELKKIREGFLSMDMIQDEIMFCKSMETLETYRDKFREFSVELMLVGYLKEENKDSKDITY